MAEVFARRPPVSTSPPRFRRPAVTSTVGSAAGAPTAVDSDFGVSFIVFCVYTFILVGRPQDYFPSLEPLRPALLLTIMSLGLTVLTRRQGASQHLRRPATRLYLSFFFVMAATVPFSIHRRLSLEFVWLEYVVNIVYFLLFLVNVNTFAKFQRVIFVVMLSTLMFSGLALKYGSFSEGRYFSKLVFDPNDIAFVVVSLLSFAVGVLLGSFRKTAKTLALVAIVMGVLLALYTGSRGGLLGLATFFILFLFVRVPGVSKTGKMLVVAILSLAIYANADKMNMDRYLTFSDIGTDYNANDEFGRVGIWSRGLTVFSEHPLTGVGVGRFGQAIGTSRMDESLLPEWQASHNSYIQVITELGIFGAGSFLFLLATALATLYRLLRGSTEIAAEVRTYAAVLLVGFIAQLVTAFFLSQAYSMFLTLSISVITALGGIVSVGQGVAKDGRGRDVIHFDLPPSRRAQR